jgi:hypothetical protein
MRRRQLAWPVLALVIITGAGAALAAGGSAARHGAPQSPADSRAQAIQRLVASKLRDGRHYAPTSGPISPDLGVQLGPPSAQAAGYAAASPIRTASAAIAAFAALGPFGSAIESGNPRATLQTVIERYPITPGVPAGVPYQAWVVIARGPVFFIGGLNSTPPPAGTRCNDIGVYDVELSKWTERMQSC